MLASSASLSCLYEAGLHGISSAEGCWIGGSNTPAPTPHSKTSEHLKLPPPTAAASTFIDRDWQQHRKLYESHNSLKLIAEELNSILRFLTKRLTAPLPGNKDAKVLLASAEDTVVQLRKENMLLLVGRRPT